MQNMGNSTLEKWTVFLIHSYFSEDQEEAAEFLQLQGQEANVEPCITQKSSEITRELNYKPLKHTARWLM